MEDKITQSLIEKKSLFVDAVRGIKKPKRVPLFSNVWTWKVFDAGYTLSEYFYNYENIADTMYKFHEKYNYDAYIDIGVRNPIKMLQNFDAEIYTVDDKNGYLNFKDLDCMEAPNGFDDMINKGYIKYIYENVIPKKYNVKDENDAIERIVKAAKETSLFLGAIGGIQKTLIEKYGVPAFCKGRYDVPPEMVFNAGLRGIQSFSTDMRRYPDKMEEMFNAMAPKVTETFFDALDTYTDDEKMVFPVRLTSLAHTIMNTKQFERFYWPFLKQYGDELEKRDMCAFIFTEGSIEHVYEFFRELPANRIALMIEMDGPKRVKEKLPNVTLVGGFPTNLLATGTKEQCIDKAKQMLDELAYDGRYIYAANKMLSYRNDAKAENMLAINDYIRENGVF